jgi:large subunit ribosomal protein L24
MQKIRKGDEVIVLKGKDRGRRGVIVSVLPEVSARVGRKAVVQGINMVKRHVKPNPQQEKPGGIIEKEAPIFIAKLAIFNPTQARADRVGFKFLEDGRKVRVFKSTGEVIDV